MMLNSVHPMLQATRKLYDRTLIERVLSATLTIMRIKATEIHPLQLELSEKWGGAELLDVEDEADDELEVGATDVVEGESYRCIVISKRPG